MENKVTGNLMRLFEVIVAGMRRAHLRGQEQRECGGRCGGRDVVDGGSAGLAGGVAAETKGDDALKFGGGDHPEKSRPACVDNRLKI
eukprot:g26587.t1